MRLLGTELLKLRTIRTPYVLGFATLALVALFAIIHVSTLSNPAPERAMRDSVDIAGVAVFFALILGILLAAGEYYHGTITQSLLAVPVRRRLVLAKVAVGAVTGLVLALLGVGLTLAVDAVAGAANALTFSLAGHGTLHVVIGTVVAGALWGALGAGFGAIVTSQTGVLVGAILWFLLGESLLRGLVPTVGRYTPGGALDGVIGTGSDALSAWSGGALSLAYVAAAAVLGVVLTERRDVT